MTIITDNVRYSTVPGVGKALTGAGIGPKIVYVGDSPDGVVTGQTGSMLAWDSANSELYMVEANGGSSWIHLVSGEAP